MARTRVIINKVTSVVLYISLNNLTDWAIKVLSCSLAVASNIAHIALPSINAPTVASTKRNLCNIQDSDRLTLGFYSSIHNGRISLCQRLGSVCSWLLLIQGCFRRWHNRIIKSCRNTLELKWWGRLVNRVISWNRLNGFRIKHHLYNEWWGLARLQFIPLANSKAGVWQRHNEYWIASEKPSAHFWIYGILWFSSQAEVLVW